MIHSHPLDRIRDAAREAPPALAAAAQWMLLHSAQAATLGIEDIARASGSSPASVNRLSRAAGYTGFLELKAALATVMRAAIDPVQKVRDEQNRSPLAPLAQYVAMGGANLEKMVRDNPEPALFEASKLLATEGRIFVLGFGLTSHIAGWLSDALAPYSHAVIPLSGSGGTEQIASRMSTIGKKDVLIAISLPRYTRDTESLARFARERGAKVLAIVDSHAAPLAREADARLFAPASHPVLPSCYASVQLLCEALVGEVVRRNPKAVEMAAELTESVVAHLVVMPSGRT